MATNTREPWHLSKSVPISLIFALVLQAGAIVWTVSSMQSDINTNRQLIAEARRDISSLESIVHSNDVKLGRIEEQLKSIFALLGRLDRKLDNDSR